MERKVLVRSEYFQDPYVLAILSTQIKVAEQWNFYEDLDDSTSIDGINSQLTIKGWDRIAKNTLQNMSEDKFLPEAILCPRCWSRAVFEVQKMESLHRISWENERCICLNCSDRSDDEPFYFNKNEGKPLHNKPKTSIF